MGYLVFLNEMILEIGLECYEKKNYWIWNFSKCLKFLIIVDINMS